VVDITDETAVRAALDECAPEIVIHGAAYTDVDGAERDPERALAVNADGSRHVAAAARAVGARLVAVSTDFVFAGEGGAPYDEAAEPRPLSIYGRSKLAGERVVLDLDPAFAVARTAWVYGGPGKHFPRTVLTVLRARGAMDVVADEVGSPTFAGDLAAALLDLAVAGGGGVFHLVNEGGASRYELARAVAGAAGHDVDAVRPTTSAEFLARYPLPARRPADSRLANRRAAALGVRLRPWPEAVAAYVPRLAAEFGEARRGG
jgi:dTDP-4-dehydrorhamnose reductase